MGNIQSFEELRQELEKHEFKNTFKKDIEFIVVDVKESFIFNYSKLTLLLNNEVNDQFIIKPYTKIEKYNKIKFKLDDVIFRTLNGKLFLEIKKLSIRPSNLNLDEKQKNTFIFPFYYVNNLSELKNIKKNSFVSIPVKIKEKEYFNGDSAVYFKDVDREQLIK